MTGLADAPILDADAARCGQLFATKDRAAAVAALLRAAGSRPRLLILFQLCDGERSVHEILMHTGLGASSVSQHLATLRRQGLVESRREGPSVYYAISAARLRPLMQFLTRTFGVACPRQSRPHHTHKEHRHEP